MGVRSGNSCCGAPTCELDADVLGGKEGLQDSTQDLGNPVESLEHGPSIAQIRPDCNSELPVSKEIRHSAGSAFDSVLEASEDEGSDGFRKREGGDFERKIADQGDLAEVMAKCVNGTVAWPATESDGEIVFSRPAWGGRGGIIGIRKRGLGRSLRKLGRAMLVRRWRRRRVPGTVGQRRRRSRFFPLPSEAVSDKVCRPNTALRGCRDVFVCA